MTVIGLVTIAALIGIGGYGALINDGLRRNFPTPIVIGATLSIILALLVDGGLALVQRSSHLGGADREHHPRRHRVPHHRLELDGRARDPRSRMGPRLDLVRRRDDLRALPPSLPRSGSPTDVESPTLSVAMVNLGRAIPSFAIIALVFPFSIRYGFGLGFWPTCVALVALGIPPMFTNAYAGVMETQRRASSRPRPASG